MKKLKLGEATSYMGIDCVVVALTSTTYTLRGTYKDEETDLTLAITSYEESKQEELDNEQAFNND